MASSSVLPFHLLGFSHVALCGTNLHISLGPFWLHYHPWYDHRGLNKNVNNRILLSHMHWSQLGLFNKLHLTTTGIIQNPLPGLWSDRIATHESLLVLVSLGPVVVADTIRFILSEILFLGNRLKHAGVFHSQGDEHKLKEILLMIADKLKADSFIRDLTK